MKNLICLFAAFLALFLACDKDEIISGGLPPMPEKCMIFENFEFEAKADSSEILIKTYLSINDTCNISIEEMNKLLEWQISSISTLNHTTNQWNEFEIEAGKDSIVGDWFTVIRDNKGEYLRVILSENLGDIRTLYIGTDNRLMGCRISQLGK